MARFEVTETTNGRTRVVTTTRRENGAIHERDRQVESSYENAQRHASRIGTRAIQGPDPRDPNAVLVGWYDDRNVYWTQVTYRRLGPDPEVEAADAALEDALYASLLAVNGATL